MQSCITFVLLCALSSSVSSTRIRQRLQNPEEDDENKLANAVQDAGSLCSDAAIEEVMTGIMDQVIAYYQQCGMDDGQHLTSEGKVFTVTEEGKDLLCKKTCQTHEAFAEGAPDYSEMLEKCDNELMTTLRTHAAFDAARNACASEAPLMDDVEVDDVVGPSPVAPLKGKRIKQQQFEYELKTALAVRSATTCENLIKAFKKCDYKKNNKVFLAQVDDMLDKLEKGMKSESLQLLKDIYDHKLVNKSPETDALTFKDWTLFKYGRKEANECALKFASGK